MEKVVIAGGCFWGVEEYFARKEGVVDTRVGYANCRVERPSYQEVCTGRTGCVEAVEIRYDETVISLDQIAHDLFKVIDPTVFNRQGPDVGTQYRTGLYYESEEQKQCFTDYVKKVQPDYELPIATEVVQLENFYPAEEYHQRYLKKNPGGYCHIRLD